MMLIVLVDVCFNVLIIINNFIKCLLIGVFVDWMINIL